MKDSKSIVRRNPRVVSDLLDIELAGTVARRTIRIKSSILAWEEPKNPKGLRKKGNCRKSRYRDLDEAIETLHRIERYRRYSSEAGREVTHRNEQRAYKCPSCLGAHLTSQITEGVSFDVAA